MDENSPEKDELGSRESPRLPKGQNLSYEGLPQEKASSLCKKLRDISPSFLQVLYKQHRGEAAHRRIDRQAAETAVALIGEIETLKKFRATQFFCLLQAYRALSKPSQQAEFCSERKKAIGLCLGLLEESLPQDPNFARWNFLTFEDTISEKDLNGFTERFKFLSKQVQILRKTAHTPRPVCN